MSIDRSIDKLVARVRAGNTSEENKARAIRALESARAVLQAIHRFILSMVSWLREHRDTAQVLVIAMLVAVLLRAVPLLGDLLAFLAILLGAIGALVVEVCRALNGLLSFDIGEDAQATR